MPSSTEIQNMTKLEHDKSPKCILFFSFKLFKLVCYKATASCTSGRLRWKLSNLRCNYKFAYVSFRGVWFIPALKDSSKRSINSDWKIELPGEFQIAGTTVRYVRRGLWEKISAKGPTKIPLHLMVTLYSLFVFLKWCNRKGLYPSQELNFDCLLPHQRFLKECCSAILCILLQHCQGWRNLDPYLKINDALFWENMQCPSKLLSSTR